MEQSSSFENESTIKELKNGSRELILTTERIRYHRSNLGSNDTVSILIDEVRSVSIRFRCYITFLFLAAISAAATYILFKSPEFKEFAPIGIAVAGLFLVLFFATKAHLAIIASAGDKIIFKMQGMSKYDALYLVDAIEKAKTDKTRGKMLQIKKEEIAAEA